MRLEVAPITDPSSLAHVSPTQLTLLMKHRAPRLAARARLPARPTLDELAEVIRGIQPEDEADDFLEDLHLVVRVCRHDGAEDLLLDKGVSLTNISLGDALARAAVDTGFAGSDAPPDRINFDFEKGTATRARGRSRPGCRFCGRYSNGELVSVRDEATSA